jgi:hypothetical protein
MPTTGSRGTEKRMKFNVRSHCQRAIDWLNEHNDDDAHRRIRQLLRSVHVLSSNWLEDIDEDDGEPVLVYRGPQKEYQNAWKRVFRTLRRYKFSPLVIPFASRMIPQWTPVSSPSGRFRGHWPPIAGRYDDVEAIFELTWMSGGEGLTRTKECKCGRWFFLRFGHQRFCSARCRDKENKSAPQWKEYRRRKAREYYWLHKTKNTK